MGLKYLCSLFFTVVTFLCTGCGGSTSSDKDTQEKNIDPVILVPIQSINEQIIFSDLDQVWPNGTSLSMAYEEYFSGYWQGSLCGGNGFAIIGVNGSSAEMNLGAYFIDPMFGSVSSDGELIFASREVSSDCEECGEVRPLETTGVVNWDLGSGVVEFEVVCSNGVGHTVSSIYVSLNEGLTQPSPEQELIRIENNVIALIGDSPTCSESLDCKLISLKSDDFCKFEALAYSVMDTDEGALLELKSEYRVNERLAYGYSGSSSTICGFVRKASCEE
ncbi:hypothetical protein N8878_08815, partial [Psychromonas sp.]|nr:hypothetical protein [Psychromonas sp.]